MRVSSVVSPLGHDLFHVSLGPPKEQFVVIHVFREILTHDKKLPRGLLLTEWATNHEVSSVESLVLYSNKVFV